MTYQDPSSLGDHPTPESCYQLALQRDDFQKDAAQAQAIGMLQGLYGSILSGQHNKGKKNRISLTGEALARPFFPIGGE